MGKPRVQIGRDLLQQAMESEVVRDALRARGRLILPAAKRAALNADRKNFAGSLRLVEGVRPGTKAGGFRRPYVRVTSRLTPEEIAADNKASRSYESRRQIIRRSARGW